jgi:hypothetical protein
MVEAWSWTNELEDLRSTRHLNKWRTGKEGPCLANRGGMMRYSIMTSSSVGRGKPVLLSSDLKSHACMQCGGLGMPRGRAFFLASWENGGLKRRRKPPVSAAIFPETCVDL